MKTKKRGKVAQPVSKPKTFPPHRAAVSAAALAGDMPITPAAAPLKEHDSTLVKLTRWVLLFFAATLPLYYDLTVPEVSGDIRWMMTSFFAGLAALLLIADAWRRGSALVTLRWPVQMWIALGLALWAAVSLIDALNWMRGIILIKALYAQLTLALVVYMVATPAFVRRLMWALVLPLSFSSFLGIAQFMDWNQANFDAALSGPWVVLKPFFALLGYVLHYLFGSWVPGWPQSTELMTQLLGFFQQSAVPGATFANKNLAGSWTAMMLPMTLYLLVTSKRFSAQALASFLLALGFLFLVYARARASWVATFAGLLTLGALLILVPAWRQAIARHLDWKHAIWLAFPIIVVGMWGRVLSPIHGAYAVDRTPSQQVAALANSSWDEIGGRLAYNLNSLVITRDYWFNGVGLGSFFVVWPPYYNAVVVTPTNSYSVAARPQRTHTDLMQAFDEMGIPGGLLYAGFFITAIVSAMRLAGRRAGRLGRRLVGAGMMTGVLAVMCFVEMQGMLAMAEPWNLMTKLLFGLIILALLAGAAYDAWKVQQEKAPADDTQLLGLMAGIGVLTISINALMDFPMQLPTAPASAALLIGAICAVYMRYYPHALIGPRFQMRWGRGLLTAAFAAVAAVWIVFLWDAWKFREGNQYLKAAMVRIYSGIDDDATKQLIDKAYEVYPRDPRIHEHMGVVYASYVGASPLLLEDVIDKLEWVIQGDPWGANQLVNLSGKYLQQAELKAAQGDHDLAKAALDRVEVLHGRLMQSADFSHFTWGVGGMLRLLQGRNEEAASMFQRALAIQPDYEPAANGLRIATERAAVKPLVVKDAITGQ